MIRDYILEQLQENYTIETTKNIDEINYVEEGYITSMGFIQFIVNLEEKFNIRFSDEEISSEDFQIIGKLVKIISKKIDECK